METADRSRKHAANHLAQSAGRAVSQALAEAVAPLGLAAAQYGVLAELWVDDGQTQSELARRLGVEQATMTNTLARMVRDGLVCREPHPRDRRAMLVRLSDKGISLRQPARAAARDVGARALAGLTKKEQDRFLAILARVSAALRRPPGSGAESL